MTSPLPEARVSAGLVDSTAASVASFLTGLLAIWTLSPNELGVYAVFMSAFLMTTYIPRQFVFIPVEMASLAMTRHQRGSVLRRSVRVGAGVSLLAALATGLAWPVSLSMAEPEFLAPMTATAMMATLLSPIQDHVRRLLHLAGRSWRAGLVSVTQLVVVTVQIGLVAGPTRVFEIDSAWLPFGALTFANLISLALGAVMSRSDAEVTGAGDLTLAALSRPGRWLVLSALSSKGSVFAASALIGLVAGTEALGHAEAARVVAQPLMVLGVGLQDVMSPRLMEAGARRDLGESLKAEQAFFRLFLLLGGGYLLVASTDWIGNPMSYLVPTAYEVPGLVAVSIVATVLVSSVYPHRLELLGGLRHRHLARVDTVAGLGTLLIALTAAVTLAFARPASVAVQGLVQMLGYREGARRVFADASNEDGAATMADRT